MADPAKPDPPPPEPLVGLLAEFPTEDGLVEATRKTADAGYRCIDTFSPYPIREVATILHFDSHRIGWLSVIGGLFGFFGTLLVQVFVNWDFPINVGGRPIYAWAAFVVVDFELMILFAVLFPIIGMLYLNGLPRLHHPLFGAARFSLASDDRYFLYVDATDPKFDPDKTRGFLASLDPWVVESVRE